MFEIVSAPLEEYIELHTSSEDEVLKALHRQTFTDVLMPRMLSGQVQGTFLTMISQILQPKRILEIGTFTGYSAICLARGLQQNGILTTIDINAELEDLVRHYFEQAGLTEKMDYKLGNALDIIPELSETYDLVFIDADKQNYSHYYHLVFEKLRKGGIILADNVLWSGRVLDTKPDKDTKALLEFNHMVQQDERVNNVILSVRDGLMMIQKK